MHGFQVSLEYTIFKRRCEECHGTHFIRDFWDENFTRLQGNYQIEQLNDLIFA